MDASPRSSKRRKLDTPTRKASTPLVKSTLRKPSGRLAGRTYVSANGDLETADDDGTTPSRRASRRVAGTPNGTVNRAVRKREVAEKSDVFDALDVFDDIDGALPPSRETPAPSPAPSQTASVKNLRKKHVLDAETTALRPSRKNAQIPATRSTASSRTVNGDSDHVVSATRKSSRTVVNGYRNEANTEAGAQEELASEAFSPTKRIKNTRAANGTHVTTARKLEPLVGKGSDRASQRATEQLDDNESLDQLQVDGVGENTPSKLRSTRKSIRSARVSSRTAIQDKDDEPNAVTPSRSSKQRASIPDSEDELGDHEPPSRGRNASDRRRVNRADHIGNGDHIISVFNDEQDYEVADNPDEGDVDGNSVLESVLDPTEPSPFNKPGLNQKTKDAPALLQANLTSGRELDLLKTIVLERINAQRPAPLVELHEQYKAVHQLIEHTVTAGEGNSMLLIGARGSGKTSLVNKVLSEVSKDNVDEYHVVRLNGFIHTDDKIALREIWRQLGKEMDIEEDGGPGKNYADTLTTLLALLSHPSEQTGEMTDQVAKAVIFIMDEFDLFATHPRQTLLYNLFDIAQSRKAPIAVLGLTTRIDVSNSLEKRVKSRFSHRYVHLSLAKTFTSFQEMCKSSLLIQPDQLSVEERSILSAAPTTTPSKKSKTPKKAITTTTTPDILTSWNANVSVSHPMQSTPRSLLHPLT